MLRVKTTHTGYPGSPGYTNHHFDEATDPAQAADHVRTFWETVAGQFVTAWRYQISPEVEHLNEGNGQLLGYDAVTPVAQATFGGPGNYAGGVGACASWITEGLVDGKHVRGRTFLVPLNSDAYDSDGTINGIALNIMRGAAEDFAATGGFGVWHHPVNGVGGQFFLAIAGTVKDRVAYLSSRRT